MGRHYLQSSHSILISEVVSSKDDPDLVPPGNAVDRAQDVDGSITLKQDHLCTKPRI